VLDRHLFKPSRPACCGLRKAVYEQGVRPARKYYKHQSQNRSRKGPQLNWNRKTLLWPDSTRLPHHYDRYPGHRQGYGTANGL
jgi:hypothetical protein